MSTNQYHIAIIGSGITGLSTAYHLQKQGADKIVIISPSEITSFSRQSAEIVCGGMGDNFTRFSHGHGLDLAKDLWAFANSGFDGVIGFAKTHKVPFVQNKRVRLIASESELKEAEQAVQELQDCKFEGEILSKEDFQELGDLKLRIHAVQNDGKRGAWLNTGTFLRKLEEELGSVERKNTSLKSLKKDSSGLEFQFKDGTKLRSEIIVFACHLQSAKFLPSMKEVLIPYADQWSQVRIPSFKIPPKGLVFSIQHGYEWGVFNENGILHLGGARYLRPLAGIGAKEALVQDNIIKHLQQQLRQTFPWTDQLNFQESKAFLDIWPCDELPVIGPMYGEDRIFISTGYMGQGFSLGFESGRALSELILKGRSDRLPRGLWPERLRSI